MIREKAQQFGEHVNSEGKPCNCTSERKSGADFAIPKSRTSGTHPKPKVLTRFNVWDVQERQQARRAGHDVYVKSESERQGR